MTVTFELRRTVSNSKGWARYAAAVNGSPMIQSRTGNEWVSASHEGDAAEGCEIIVRTQTMLRVGKGRTERESRYNHSYVLRAEPEATCEIGSSFLGHLHIVIRGARMLREIE